MYRKGKSSPKSTVVVYSWKYKALKNAAIGITASKKLGGAVERNRARRIIREAYRTLVREEKDLNSKPYYFIFVARKKCFLKTTRMQDVLSDMKSAFRELNIIGEEK